MRSIGIIHSCSVKPTKPNILPEGIQLAAQQGPECGMLDVHFSAPLKPQHQLSKGWAGCRTSALCSQHRASDHCSVKSYLLSLHNGCNLILLKKQKKTKTFVRYYKPCFSKH